MKLSFTYALDRDVWCLLHYGKTSMNSDSKTKVYEELVAEYNENPTKEDVEKFVAKYLNRYNTKPEETAQRFNDEWLKIEKEYHARAENIFGTRLTFDVTCYLTVNTRCPYSIPENMFYCSMYSTTPVRTAMHELWHFYTWQKYGKEVEDKLGRQVYNDVKESLTVLLNVVYKDLLPEGVVDYGYLQHQEKRKKILLLWNEGKTINEIWEEMTKI
jgi:hypothetical protein